MTDTNWFECDSCFETFPDHELVLVELYPQTMIDPAEDILVCASCYDGGDGDV